MFDKIKNRKDYISVDKLTAISAEGEIFHVGDTVYHEGDIENKPGIIQKFELDVEDNSILAFTEHGSGHISFLYYKED